MCPNLWEFLSTQVTIVGTIIIIQSGHKDRLIIIMWTGHKDRGRSQEPWRRGLPKATAMLCIWIRKHLPVTLLEDMCRHLNRYGGRRSNEPVNYSPLGNWESILAYLLNRLITFWGFAWEWTGLNFWSINWYAGSLPSCLTLTFLYLCSLVSGYGRFSPWIWYSRHNVKKIDWDNVVKSGQINMLETEGYAKAYLNLMGTKMMLCFIS